MQGNYTVEGLQRTAPPPEYISSLSGTAAGSLALIAGAKSAAGGAVAQATGVNGKQPEEGKGPLLSKPAVKPPEPQIDPAPSVAALQKVLQGLGDKKGTRLHMKVFGTLQEVVFAGADVQALKVEIKGNVMPLRWKDVAHEDLAQSAFTLCHDDQEALFHAGMLAAVEKQDVLYEKIFFRLMEVSSARGMSLDDIKAGR